MRAASENLTPVTLELGGKSPAIIHEDFPVEVAAQRIAFGKTFSAGQACIAPDYALCPEDKMEAFKAAFEAEVRTAFPTMQDNPEYTSLITTRQKARLQFYLEDAKDKGAEIREINPAGESFDSANKMPVTLVSQVTEEMQIMQEEIFGPLLVLIPYAHLREALAFVNARPRPLAIYYFDWSKARADEVMEKTHSGGFGWNDTMSQITVDDLPWGGIGPSGMGHYHGEEGFRTFSHAKAVVAKGRLDSRRPFYRAPRKNGRFGIFNRLVGLKLRRR